METILDRMNALCAATGKSAAAVCRDANVATNVISNMRTKGRIPHRATMEAICNAHNASLTWLITGDGEMFRAKTPDPVQEPEQPKEPEIPAVVINGVTYIPADSVKQFDPTVSSQALNEALCYLDILLDDIRCTRAKILEAKEALDN